MDVFGEIQAEDATVKFHFPFQLEMLEEGKEEFWDAMSNSESGAGSRPVSLRPGSTIYGSILYNSWRMSRPISVISTTSFDERQRNRQIRPISMQLEHPISRYYPVFTIAITVAIWLSFILGIVLSDELSLSSLGWHTPVSPPNVQWWFYTVGPFPSCTDERFKAWRLLSMQLVHSGLQHIGGNSACILIYGSVLEMYHPLSFLSTIIVFETAIAVGVLGYSALSPYTGLVGASPGAYGLIGACWYVAIAHRDLVDPVVAFVLPMVLAAQLAIDLLFFYVDFNPTTAYSSHIVGLVTGFVVAMTMTVTYRKISWGAIFTSLGGILVFSALVGLLLWHYLLFFPPSPLVSPLLHNLATRDACCHRLFALMDEYPHRSQASLAASMATCSDDY